MHPWKRFILRYGRYLFCHVFALSFLGCAARYSTENLRSLAPAAELIDVCVRMPTVESDAVVVAHNSQAGTSVSDRDWEAFERAAETAEVIYRYDPNAPEDSAKRLPWPYHKMSCRRVSSSEKVPLLQGMKEIAISAGMREALVSALLVDEPMRPSPTASVAPDKRFLGQVSFSGIGPRATYSSEAIDEVGQMLRDTLRTGLPKVPNGAGGQISILDTTAGQVVGGLGAGAFIGTTPGGALIAATLDANPDLQQPTRLFRLGQAGGEMVSGALQFFIGTGGTVGGVGLSMSGGGAVLGVPTCVAGAALAANGTITFLHGAHTLVVTICHWDELPSANAAQQAPPNTPTPTPAAPAAAPAAAAPAPAPGAAPSEPALATPEMLRPPRKPATQPPVAAAPQPQPAAPPPKLTAPTQTTTKTIHKGPNGEIVKTVTKTGDSVTMSQPKKAPPQARVDVEPKVSDAPKAKEPQRRNEVVEKTASGKRAGDFTRSQKSAAKANNAARNGGDMACTDCGRDLKNVGSEKGVPTPPHQAQVHHDPPIVQGGGKHSTPVVVCPECHIKRHVHE